MQDQSNALRRQRRQVIDLAQFERAAEAATPAPAVEPEPAPASPPPEPEPAPRLVFSTGRRVVDTPMILVPKREIVVP